MNGAPWTNKCKWDSCKTCSECGELVRVRVRVRVKVRAWARVKVRARALVRVRARARVLIRFGFGGQVGKVRHLMGSARLGEARAGAEELYVAAALLGHMPRDLRLVPGEG